MVASQQEEVLGILDLLRVQVEQRQGEAWEEIPPCNPPIPPLPPACKAASPCPLLMRACCCQGTPAATRWASM